MDLSRFSHLTTERLRLVPPFEVDADDLVSVLNDKDIIRWLSRVPFPYARCDAEAMMARTLAERQANWSIFDDDGLAGGIGLVDHLGYWIARRAWGNGYATEAARAVLSAYFADHNASDVVSSYFRGNEPSANVLKKLGFVETAPVKLMSKARHGLVSGMGMVLTRERYEVQPRFTLHTKRLLLNGMQPEDLPTAQAEWGDPRVAQMTATVKPNWSLAEARNWLAQRERQSRTGFGLAIRLPDGTLIGSVGMGGTPLNLGYMLGPRYWGNGYATEAVHAFVLNAYRQVDELDVIEAAVFDDNPASARILQKLGFARVGAGDCTNLGRVEPAANSLYRLNRAALKAIS